MISTPYGKAILFAFFLIPLTVDQYSVNYFFVLFCLVSILFCKKISPNTNDFIKFSISYFVLLFVAAAIWATMSSEATLVPRMAISFMIFMSMFAFVPMHLEANDIAAFRLALIGASVALAGYSLALFFVAGGNIVGWDQRNIVGTQRTGFALILGLAVLLNYRLSGHWLVVAKSIGIFMILAGLLLTFARASVLGGGAALCLCVLIWMARRSSWTRQGLRQARKIIGIAALYCVALAAMLPSVVDFYIWILVDRYAAVIVEAFYQFGEPGALRPRMSEVFRPDGSEGIRLELIKTILLHTLQSPILGTGYLGVWRITDGQAGSAHNQYLDVLLRTGIMGLALYLTLLYKVFKLLYQSYRDMFFGGVGVLVYGLFHETFKEAQGAFILAFLIGLYATHCRSLDTLRSVAPGIAPPQTHDRTKLDKLPRDYR